MYFGELVSTLQVFTAACIHLNISSISRQIFFYVFNFRLNNERLKIFTWIMKLSRKRISCEIARVKLSPRATSPTHRQKPTQQPFLSPELFRCEMLLHPAQFGRGCLADSLCESYLSVGLNALCSLVLRLFYETFDRHK